MPPNEQPKKGVAKKRAYKDININEEHVTNSATSSHDSEDDFTTAKSGKRKPKGKTAKLPGEKKNASKNQ
jgi:hypothetical protein